MLDQVSGAICSSPKSVLLDEIIRAVRACPSGALSYALNGVEIRDGVDQAAEAGVRAIVQPGGSVRDGEVIAAADEHGIAMVFTGKRQFRH